MLSVSLRKNFCPFTCLFARVSLSPLCLFLSTHLVLCRRFRKNTMATLLKPKLIRWQVLHVHLFVATDRVSRSHFILDFYTISKCFSTTVVLSCPSLVDSIMTLFAKIGLSNILSTRNLFICASQFSQIGLAMR